jgi:hypothetical protein
MVLLGWALLPLLGCAKVAPAAGKALVEALDIVGPDLVKQGENQLKEKMDRDRRENDARFREQLSGRFPNPGAVEPLPGTRPVFDADTGLYRQPNNFGGFSFYQADRSPAGFSARHSATGQIHYFDPFGNRLR